MKWPTVEFTATSTKHAISDRPGVPENPKDAKRPYPSDIGCGDPH